MTSTNELTVQVAELLEQVKQKAIGALTTVAMLTGFHGKQKLLSDELRGQIADGVRTTMKDGMRYGQAVSLVLEHIRDTELTPEQHLLAADLVKGIESCMNDDEEN